MAKTDSLTAERLRELLHYDPETGIFTRRVRTSNRIKVGDVAGYQTSEGYIEMRVVGYQHKAHRLAWLYMTGEWPTHQIDHKDTIRHHNWWDNLRLATNAQNQQNVRKARSDNKCGFLGVHRDGNRWKAAIQVDGNRVHLGMFRTPELAHAAYLAAKADLHPYQTVV